MTENPVSAPAQDQDAAASEEELCFRALIRSLPDQVIIVDLERRIVDVNDLALEAMGSTHADVVGRRCYEVQHGFHAPCEQFGDACPIGEVLRTGRTASCQHRHLTARGEERVLDIRLSPLLDRNGRISRVVEVARDVTDAVALQAALAQRERYLGSVLAATPAGMGVIQGRVFLEVNARMAEMTGYTKDELVGQDSRMLYPTQEEYDRIGATWYPSLTANASATIETCWVRKDGRVINVLVSSSALSEHDTSHLTFAIQDITELRKAEQQQREMEAKLAAAERRQSLAVVAAGVAHDLKNIVTPVVALPDLVAEVLERASEASPQEIADAQEDLRLIADAASRAVSTIQDLKELGHRVDMVRHPLDLCQTVRKSLETSDVRALRNEYPSIQVTLSLPTTPVVVSGNGNALHRALLNLVLNAMEAVGDTGRVDVEVESIDVPEPLVGFEVTSPGRYGVLHVRDTGHGIPDDVLARMFEPFVSTKDGVGTRSGSGLGLAVVLSIVKDHLGYVDVRRDCDGWPSAFSLYLPLAPVP